MRSFRALAALLCLLFATCIVGAEDDEAVVPYFQTAAFNVPLLTDWEDRSSPDIAQFHLEDAKATIRAALVQGVDPLSAASADLQAALEIPAGDAIYQGKVNLADGTWTVLIMEPDAATSASLMTRRLDESSIVISFIERDPESRILMLAMAQSGDPSTDASAELQEAAQQLLSRPAGNLGEAVSIELPSGDWLLFSAPGRTLMAMAFGNDSYLALQEGAGERLPQLADAWNSALLGFFVTPDNSRYLALALAASAFILLSLIFSFYWRWRNLAKDLAFIDALRAEAD